MQVTEMSDEIDQHRQYLFAVAYRMLGSISEAEDAVQETFLKWQKCDRAAIQSQRAWMTTVITRICINHLKSARVQREHYVGEWLPEPFIGEAGAGPQENLELAESLSMAFLVLLETLTPTERAVFLLREVFDYEFSEIAQIVEKSEVNCRQLLGRARKHIQAKRPSFEIPSEEAKQLLKLFQEALVHGDVQALLKTLSPGVVFVSDGGGNARAVLRPVSGADTVARLLIGAVQKFGSMTEIRRYAIVNNLPGIVSFEDGRPVRVVAFGICSGAIQALYVITNPDKLRHLKNCLR
jgi:RNA polymerase sigma-70 factor (ECF subfamily)